MLKLESLGKRHTELERGRVSERERGSELEIKEDD